MRPGRAEDLPAILELWGAEVRSGRRDCAPSEVRLRPMLADFDWAAKSRLVQGERGKLAGAVLVIDRATTDGTVTRVDPAAEPGGDGRLIHELTRWGLQLSRAAGAISSQVWLGPGHAGSLSGLGLEPIRPWWRMDRSLAGELPDPSPIEGYELRDARLVAAGAWADVNNRSFADHWRYRPRSEQELMTDRPPELSLLAVSATGERAALTLCQLETYTEDRRPQPVGIVMSVGTLPEHRRRGLATWLVAEGMLRLREAGASHASLYVDGRNQTRAYDVYRKLGFEIAFETEVWEATFP